VRIGGITTRAARGEDVDFLWSCLALAAHEADVDSVKQLPSVAAYLKHWKRSCDFAVVAERKGAPIGAAWARFFSEDERPSLRVSLTMPTVCVAVVPGERGAGVGHALLDSLKQEARRRGVALCLVVDERNSARHLYEREGFRYLASVRIANRAGSHSLGMVWTESGPITERGVGLDYVT
jgi:GNAT superfamily N-acetyltransferase